MTARIAESQQSWASESGAHDQQADQARAELDRGSSHLSVLLVETLRDLRLARLEVSAAEELSASYQEMWNLAVARLREQGQELTALRSAHARVVNKLRQTRRGVAA